MEKDYETFDKEVRYHVYDSVMKTGKIPTVTESASLLSCPSDEVQASFVRLADAHILVLQKGNGEILMANPFSAVPTPFIVKLGAKSYYANCIWDAMGISAILNQDAKIVASCGCCGTAMNITIKDGMPEKASGIAHFAVPAKNGGTILFTTEKLCFSSGQKSISKNGAAIGIWQWVR
jgi:hypothetical protein